MRPKLASTHSRPVRLVASLALGALLFLTTGFSSCAGTTGPLLVPIHITPGEVILRSSRAGGQEAIALARIDNDDSNDRYRIAIAYDKDPGVQWLTVEVAGRNLTLRATPVGLNAGGVYRATVSVEGETSGATATLQVEYLVTD